MTKQDMKHFRNWPHFSMHQNLPNLLQGPVLVEEEEDSLPEVTTLDFDHPDMIILPPPDMYADLTVE
ncbi:hypothetical protein KUCAC02_023305 [Chaenocephalus aceratus]|uniref:Uncharacterized protein n=1 Tax=Chaenocephalus aceratus TaxID=36190 RepID=A0ACB9XPL5_CHAAC|nr:hypothetical protein KUCAC02_023305 [Chaenocephalus aceratus]